MKVYLKQLFWPDNPEQLAKMGRHVWTHKMKILLQEIVYVFRAIWLSEVYLFLMHFWSSRGLGHNDSEFLIQEFILTLTTQAHSLQLVEEKHVAWQTW